jgi:hypothetical protein
MKGKWLGVLAVLGLAVGIVVYKRVREPHVGPGARASSGAEAPRVLLFADPNEADEVGGCGDIFRLVRSAGAADIPVLEIDPRGSAELAQKHRVVVQPTVIVLDDSGVETARFEGEDSTTIAAIASALEDLTRAGK